MALNGTWDAASQLMAHRVTSSIATRPEFGMSPFNIPEGMFVYTKGGRVEGVRGAEEVEFTVDLELKKLTHRGIDIGVVLLGIQFMCPRCNMGLHVNSEESKAPGARKITVHWDKITPSQVDGKHRPLVSVEDALSCDYSWHEINGVLSPPNPVHSKCGWRGMLEEGRMYDHAKSSLVLVAG